MIISRAPVRIPLGGGGTDLPAYYQKYEGALLTAAVNKYVYVIVKEHFEKTVRFNGYYNKEVVNSASEVKHPVVGAALRLLEIDQPVEIVSLLDVPANTGLGASSAFTVALLNALHVFKGENPSRETLAQEAFTIERVILNEPGGVQDQYIAAYGGVLSIAISTKGEVMLTPLKIDTQVVRDLENKLVFFYTNLQRSAVDIQGEHVQSITRGDEAVIESLHEIKRIGLESKKALTKGDLDRFGQLLDEHWNQKKRVGDNITTSSIDRWYQLAMNSGALGGKLMGAGGGGFLMFYCPVGHRDQVCSTLTREGLREINLLFEPAGSKLLVNI
jgi:D-glycero-alpha-D-manno-heptose-7-phosphate kinase